jgi:L1 cell adhesion molecule like protein
LLIIFKESGHRNYAKEAATLLITLMFTASERVATQIKTSCFVNTKGRVGCNMPCDLFQEHLNRVLKGMITRLESNIHSKSLCRAAKVIGIVDEICRNFGAENNQHESDLHRKPSFNKDFQLIHDTLTQMQVFNYIPNRKHTFVALSKNLLPSVDNNRIKEWIIQNHIPYFI